MQKIFHFWCCLIVIMLSTQVKLTAQTSAIAADKVIAVVGDKVILESDLNLVLHNQQDEHGNHIAIDDSTSCSLLREMIGQKILIEQADRDSVIVSDDEVENDLNRTIQKVMSQFGGDEALLQRQTGMTINQVKENYRPDIKNKLVAEMEKNALVKNVKITPQEVDAYFKSIPESNLPFFPATVEVGQIVEKPVASSEVEKIAKDKLEDIRNQIINDGKSFETMAQIYSEDPGSRDKGGYMEAKRQMLDPAFSNAALKLQPGEISPVFRSSFGYHIIQMISRQGDDLQFRHILVIPTITSFDVQKVVSSMDSLYTQLTSGKITFKEAVARYNQDQYGKMTGGMVMDQVTGSTILPVERLSDPEMSLNINDIEVGQFSKPQLFMDPYTRAQEVRILYLKSRKDPHKGNIQDDFTFFQSRALEKKKTEFLQKWLKDKSETHYIRVDKSYQGCTNLLDLHPIFK